MSCSAILGDLSASSNCSEVRWKNGELFPLGGDGIRRPQTQELRKSEIFVRRKIIGSAESWGRKLDPSKQVGSPPAVGPPRPASVAPLTAHLNHVNSSPNLERLTCIHPSHPGSRNFMQRYGLVNTNTWFFGLRQPPYFRALSALRGYLIRVPNSTKKEESHTAVQVMIAYVMQTPQIPRSLYRCSDQEDAINLYSILPPQTLLPSCHRRAQPLFSGASCPR